MADRAILSVRGLVIAPGARPVTQTIAPGEIVGLAGLDGHGQERFLKVLAGLEQPVAGEVTIDAPAGPRAITSFRKAVASGIAYLPRDRRATGIFPTQSVLDNFAVSTLSRDIRFGLLDFAARRRRYEAYRDRLSIVAPRPDASITTLSGGNQQKVLLARALALEPAILLLNDPTRGVDFGAKRDLYALLAELARDGLAVVMLSSELDEHVELMDRVLVFREHQLQRVIDREDLSRLALVSAFFGEGEGGSVV
jgi:ribose transport system ATP-binding protein